MFLIQIDIRRNFEWILHFSIIINFISVFHDFQENTLAIIDVISLNKTYLY